MRRWKTAVGTITAMAALGAAGACTGPGDEEEAGAEPAKVDLVDLLNENERLFAELWETEPKVVRACLEDQGFTVHDETALHRDYALGVDTGGLQEDYYGFQEWLPTTGMAAEWGFGQWLWTSEDYEAREEYDALKYPDQTEHVEEEAPDDAAFEALDVEERIAWYEAYLGPERMAHDDLAWRLRHPDADESEIAARQAETQEDGSGEIDLETEATEPKPGGCELEMIQALYGEPRLVEEEVEEGLSLFTWQYRPEAPVAPPNDEAAIAADTAEAADAFLTCVADRGFGEWRFPESRMLPVNVYFGLVYEDEYYTEAAEGLVDGSDDLVEEARDSMPELPDDLPSDFEGRKAHEIDMAVAFADCADEAGYREAVMAAFDAAELEAYRSIETELFAYQDALRDSLATAQELIEA